MSCLAWPSASGVPARPKGALAKATPGRLLPTLLSRRVHPNDRDDAPGHILFGERGEGFELS